MSYAGIYRGRRNAAQPGGPAEDDGPIIRLRECDNRLIGRRQRERRAAIVAYQKIAGNIAKDNISVAEHNAAINPGTHMTR